MSENATVLLHEDFSDLPVGVIAGDYSPAGEYHVVPALSESGRWRETVLHHSYKRISLGNWQVVLETDGQKVLEQTIRPQKWQPILVTGLPYDWRNVTVEAGLRPLTLDGYCAIIFRYRHARRFYAVGFRAGNAFVFRRDNDDDTVLGETACTLDPDRYQSVRIRCSARQVQVEIEGHEVLSCADDSGQAFEEGGVGFSADDVTRFRDLCVRASAQTATEIDEKRVTKETATAQLRSRHPQARLWKKFSTAPWGSDRNLRVGDINGDGKAEIVLARRTNRLGGDNYCSITSLAAFSLEGEQLWSYGEPGTVDLHTTSDLCFQVHDTDRDGKAEVWFGRDHELCVADGSTGRILRRMTLPRLPKTGEARDLHRILGDSIYFCDLTGSGRPDSFIIKDRYQYSWAYDKDFNLLWHFSGNLGHYPIARDLNGDGKDEVAIGYHLLTADGTAQWSVKYIEHADNVALVDLHDSGTDTGKVSTRFVMAASDAGFFILDMEGRERVHYPIGHAQSLCIANVLPERPGLEIVCNTFWGPAGITATFDEAGTLLHEFEPMPYACLLQPVNWVPLENGARPADLLLLSTHPEQGGLIDGKGRRLVTFPDDGHPVLCSDARDLDGDGIDEVLTWDEKEIWIYKADEVNGRGPENYPHRNPWYNDSNYRAQLSLPDSI